MRLGELKREHAHALDPRLRRVPDRGPDLGAVVRGRAPCAGARRAGSRGRPAGRGLRGGPRSRARGAACGAPGPGRGRAGTGRARGPRGALAARRARLRCAGRGGARYLADRALAQARALRGGAAAAREGRPARGRARLQRGRVHARRGGLVLCLRHAPGRGRRARLHRTGARGTGRRPAARAAGPRGPVDPGARRRALRARPLLPGQDPRAARPAPRTGRTLQLAAGAHVRESRRRARPGGIPRAVPDRGPGPDGREALAGGAAARGRLQLAAAGRGALRRRARQRRAAQRDRLRDRDRRAGRVGRTLAHAPGEHGHVHRVRAARDARGRLRGAGGALQRARGGRNRSWSGSRPRIRIPACARRRS